MNSLRTALKQVPGAPGLARLCRKVMAYEMHVRRISTPRKLRGATKLHLGAGFRQLEGWANIDLDGPNIIWDLTTPLPMKDASVRFVYSEHFIEHVTRKHALKLLKNIRELLTPGGVLRVSTPDLAHLARAYLAGNLLQMPSHQWVPTTLCEMLNDAMREWGHQYIYDEPELRSLLAEAGFEKVVRVRRNESGYSELVGLESRADAGDLIMEASVPTADRSH